MNGARRSESLESATLHCFGIFLYGKDEKMMKNVVLFFQMEGHKNQKIEENGAPESQKCCRGCKFQTEPLENAEGGFSVGGRVLRSEMVPEMAFKDCFLSFVFRCLFFLFSGWISRPRGPIFPLGRNQRKPTRTDGNQRKRTGTATWRENGFSTGGLRGVPLTESFPQPGDHLTSRGRRICIFIYIYIYIYILYTYIYT